MDVAELPFREVWAADFEFSSDSYGRQKPVCVVAKELKTGRTIRLWEDEFGPAPPYQVGNDTLFVAFFASAEFGCHLALGWPMPRRVLDLFTEYRCLTNGPKGVKASLLKALDRFGLGSIEVGEKEKMRHLAMRGGPWTAEERHDLLAYCQSDVVALERLLPAMLPYLELPYALLRGRYMIASARMEYHGVPIDLVTLERLRRHWPDIQDSLIADIDTDYGVFVGRTFKRDRFIAYLESTGMPWPRLVSGDLDMRDRTFREMSRIFPQVSALRELRAALSKMRLNALEVGADSRSRCLLSPFQARSGRNLPSSSRFIFGPSVWLRGLIKPSSGYGIAYIDWEQQEFGIAAALSGDPAMLSAYTTGDPYLEFAKQAGAVPADATKKSHPTERDQFKACALGVQYGMAAYSLASRIGQPPIVARRLLELHRETYPKFWRWSNGAVSHALLNNYLYTVFRWYVHIGPDFNPRSLSNFPMQANGAEMLRLACCLATERGIEVCAPVHDAVLIAAPLDRLDYDVERMRMAMTEASRVVLEGFELRTEVAVVRYPDRYMDEKRGRVMWDKVMTLLDGAELEAA